MRHPVHKKPKPEKRTEQLFGFPVVEKSGVFPMPKVVFGPLASPLKVKAGNILLTLTTPRQANTFAEVLNGNGYGELAQRFLDLARCHFETAAALFSIVLPLEEAPEPSLLWFNDSPDTGHPDCLCSVCRLAIPETNRPILRLFEKQGDQTLEMRFHHACIPAVWGIRGREDDETNDEEPE